jgi:LysM repeat protein
MISTGRAKMKPWKRLSFYLMINVVVSALTTWIVISVWDRTHPQEGITPEILTSLTQTSLEANETGVPGGSALANGGITPTPSNMLPTQAVEEYQVSANDTLGEIADKYGLTVDEIMQFNQLKDPNALSVGMVIYIPVTPEFVPSETPVSTPTKSPQTTGSPPAASGDAHVVINSVIGVSDLSSERVFLSRTGSGVLLLDGWKLKDQNGNEFVFPYLELFEGGAVNVWTTVGTPNVVDLYWGLQYPVWQSGETVTLVDADGKVQATYKIP